MVLIQHYQCQQRNDDIRKIVSYIKCVQIKAAAFGQTYPMRQQWKPPGPWNQGWLDEQQILRGEKFVNSQLFM